MPRATICQFVRAGPGQPAPRPRPRCSGRVSLRHRLGDVSTGSRPGAIM